MRKIQHIVIAGAGTMGASMGQILPVTAMM